MHYEKMVAIEVNGRLVTACVTLSAPGLRPDDHVDAQMILAAVAANQDRTFVSRHHAGRQVRVLAASSIPARSTPLRLAA